jgi:macrolide-specific efflux system membrane fusion protein
MLAGCSHGSAPANTRVSNAAVHSKPQAIAVARRDIVGFVPLRGTVAAPTFSIADVRASYAAPVRTVAVTLGANVRRGQLIVTLAEPIAGESYTVAKQNVQTAEAAYTSAKAQYDAAITAAADQLKEAKAAASTSSETGPTAAGASTSTPDLPTAETAYAQAVADRTNGLLYYQETLTAARAAYADAKAGRKMSRITAPISGTVVALNVQPGRQPSAAVPLCTIMDMRSFRVEAPMRPDQARYVVPGMSVQLTFNEVPNTTYKGAVTRISYRPIPPTGDVTVTGAQPVAIISFGDDGHVRPLAHATANVSIGQVKNALAVPSSAIGRDKSGQAFVDVKAGKAWKRVIVQPGATDGQYTAIRSGLTTRDVVLAPAPGPSVVPASYR